MPLYEYMCKKDGRFELIRKFSDPPLKACPTCGRKVEKLLSSPAIQFKGTGWYITDYARKGKDGAGKDGAGKDGAGKDGSAKETKSPSGDSGKSESASKSDVSSGSQGSSKSESSAPSTSTKPSAASGGSTSK